MKKYLILKWGEATYNALRLVGLCMLIFIPIAIAATFYDIALLNYLLENKKYLWMCFWVIFALFSGWAEAILFDKYSQLNIHLDINPHILLNGLRFFVWLPLIPLCGIWIAGACAMMFPFIHDGKYYAHRNTLNNYIYLKRFWADPEKGINKNKAVIDLPLWLRSLSFIGGVLIVILKG